LHENGRNWEFIMLRPLPIHALLALPALLAGLFLAQPARAEADPAQLCAAQVARAESLNGIPKGLLGAISTVESGRWDRERRMAVAWPWTVTSGGDGQFFPTKAEAIAEVRRLKAKGVRNIDVGCMQINLHHHADAFDSLEEAFDPFTNTAYAARFLRALFDSHQDWMTAASHYHSATPELGARYRQKVLAAWNGESAVASAAQPASYELTQGADWTYSRPVNKAASANAAAPSQPPLQLASASETPTARKAASQPVKSAPVPAQVSETAREEAKAFANAWREAKLAEYRNRKTAALKTL
jgi:hypothetical protein